MVAVVPSGREVAIDRAMRPRHGRNRQADRHRPDGSRALWSVKVHGPRQGQG